HDPGYAKPPTTQSVYFGQRGIDTFPSVSAVDLALNYDIPLFKVLSPWVKATVFNVFNSHYLRAYNTSILPCDPADPPAGCAGTPVDANGLPTTFVKSPSFRQARSATDYQAARRFILSAGVRF